MKINVKGSIIPSNQAWIYDYFGIENTNPKAIQRALEQAAGEDVDVEINSGGGDVFAGSEIYSALRSYDGTVRIHVVGLAASAASVIACAAHSDITPTAQMMVHNVRTWADGDYREMDHTSEVLRKANRAIASAYMEKTGMSEKEALALMDRETWMTAQDAVDAGLIDEISKPKQEVGQLVAAACDVLPAQLIAKMQQERMNLQMEILSLKGEERHDV